VWRRVCTAVAAGLGVALAGDAGAQVSPRVVTPAAGDYVFGAQIPFSAEDENGICAQPPASWEWFFREPGTGWPPIGFRFDDPSRLLGDRLIPLGCELPPAAPDPSCEVSGVYDGNKRYEVKVRMCGVDSPAVAFRVVYAPLPDDPPHPSFPDDDLAPGPPPNDGDYCFVDWGPVDTNGVVDHAATEHFNVFWPASYALCDASIANNPPQPTLPPPTAARLGVMECTYAILDSDMLAPLSAASIYRNDPLYSGITKLPFITGMTRSKHGGGKGEIQGQSHGPFANSPASDWVPVHELFHVFDYAGNPLHFRARDFRYQNNPYHFFHEAPAVFEQALSASATRPWGYRSDSWPAWIPLDLGLTELDYDAAPFWAFAIDRYGFGPRQSLRGPAIDACESMRQTSSSGTEIRPHRFKFFEAWNAQVRVDLGAVQAILREYVPLECPLASHYGPTVGGAAADALSNNGTIYTGMRDPACLQTLEYELAVVEDIARANAGSYAGTPLEESLLVDFAVEFAKAFPPLSLLGGMPASTVCPALPGLQLSRGFDAAPLGCLQGGPADASFPAFRADQLICGGVNPHDFWSRISFRITDGTPKWLRLLANDDATLYVDGVAVIDGADPFGNANFESFPPASTTYTDQRFEFPDNHAPRSSVVPIGDPRARRFEIEWVNRGESRANGDSRCRADGSRYLLELDGYNPVEGSLGPLPPGAIEITHAEFWSSQGSGYPPGGPVFPYPLPPSYSQSAAPLAREIQLRPVTAGGRPFLLPPLAAHYHPVECPAGYVGVLEVAVRDDRRTNTRPSVQLLALKATPEVEWRGRVPARDLDEWTVTLICDGLGGPAEDGGDPAFLLVTAARTPGAPGNPDGTLGAVHYTVLSGDPALDGDGDGIADYRDDCPHTFDPAQLDGGGVGNLLPDWIGDACQCGDVSGDGAVLPDDVAQIRSWLVRARPSLPVGNRCNVIGPAASTPLLDCDLRDLTVLRRILSADRLAPGLEPVCLPALP